MPLAARLGRRAERRGRSGPDIRKPGDLPAPELNRTDGVFRDLRKRVALPPLPLADPRLRMNKGMGMTAILHICTTCRAGQPVTEDDPCPGEWLHRAVLAQTLPSGVTVRPVRCLATCDQGCSVALSKPGCWSYVYGHMSQSDAAEILRGAALYAASPDGLVPWRDRPQIFRKHGLARLPPMEP